MQKSEHPSASKVQPTGIKAMRTISTKTEATREQVKGYMHWRNGHVVDPIEPKL